MKKKSINFTSRIAVAKKISIKALDFEKLPRKFSGSNYMGNAFLNITRSSSNRGPKDNLTSSLTKNKGKMLFAKPLTSRSRNENAIKLNVIPKTAATVINITPGQKVSSSYKNNNLNNINSNNNNINNNSKQKPLNKLFAQSLYVSYNNSSSTYQTFNSNNQNFGSMQKSLNVLNKMESKPSSRNQSKSNNYTLANNSTFSVFMNSKDSMNITSGTIEKIKKISNLNVNKGNTKINNIHNVNENMSLTKSSFSSHNNNSNNKNLKNNNNLIINNNKGIKNTFKHFSSRNSGSLSHKKLGIKVKKNINQK